MNPEHIDRPDYISTSVEGRDQIHEHPDERTSEHNNSVGDELEHVHDFDEHFDVHEQEYVYGVSTQ